jgi:hypothetical protein
MATGTAESARKLLDEANIRGTVEAFGISGGWIAVRFSKAATTPERWGLIKWLKRGG